MWTFSLPTKIHFGAGSSAKLGELPELTGKRIAVVSDPVISALAPVRAIVQQLAPVCEFTGVQPNPTVANADSLAALLRQHHAEIVVAIGGGSALDCAKAGAFLAPTNEPSIRAYHSGGKAFDTVSIPVIALPTTAGTGSEVTPISVLDDEEKNFKGPMASPRLSPVCAVVDSDLTLSVPLKVTAATALDALSHAIEGFWSKNHQPLCDALAMEAARTIFIHLPKVYDNLNDATSREVLSYAALTAGIAFQMPKNAIMHACSYPLSNRAHLAHGAACAFTMEAAIRLNAPHMNGRMETFARHCGFDTIDQMTRAITSLKRRGQLPCTLKDAGIDSVLLETIITESFHPLMNNNPKTVTTEDLRNMYERLADNG